MATPIIMPNPGKGVESCYMGKWHKLLGERVEVGDILFTYETGKTAFDEVSPVAGQLLAVFFEEGDDVPCDAHVAVIGENGENASSFDPNRR